MEQALLLALTHNNQDTEIDKLKAENKKLRDALLNIRAMNLFDPEMFQDDDLMNKEISEALGET